MTTLINGLQSRDGQFGLETMCVGGGQGMAIVVERLSDPPPTPTSCDLSAVLTPRGLRNRVHVARGRGWGPG